MKKYKVICPLINFRMPWNMLRASRTAEEAKELLEGQRERVTRGIDLVDEVRMRLISKEDMEDLKTAPSFFYPPGAHELISPRMFVLEKRIEVGNGEGFDLRKVFRSIVLSLRLLKGGIVFGSYVFRILTSKMRQLTSWSYEEDRPRTDPRTYVLDFEEVPKLRKLAEKILGMDFSKRKSLDLACRRFQRAYEEKDAEDQLIDLMIAFEALFLKGEKGGPSPGKIVAVACSTLLGKNDEEREIIKRTLNKAYTIRNHVVHGSEYRRIESDDKGDVIIDTLPVLVSEVEDYLRESIKKLLD